MSGSISYLEIGAGNAAESQRFFGCLFGWPFHPTKNLGEGWFQDAGMRIGLHGADPAPGILVFFEVTHMALSVARVVELGGTAEVPGPAEEDFGSFCLCADPQGVPFGLRQLPASRADPRAQ